MLPPKTNIMLYVNYISIFLKMKDIKEFNDQIVLKTGLFGYKST